MNILYLTRSQRVEVGGLDRYSYEVISRMRRQPGIAVRTLVEIASGQPDEHVALKDASRSFFALAYNIGSIRRAIRDCDIIHALDLYPYGLAVALANIGINKPLFINGVGTWSVARLDHWFYGLILCWTYRRARKVLCISAYTKQKILEKYSELNNLEVIYLGIDNQKFQRSQLGHSDSGQVLIGVGALKRRKGYHITIPAIARLVSKYRSIKYYIVGSQSIGTYTDSLKELVRNLHLEDYVIFLEDVSDAGLVNLYYQSDIFVLTSVNVGEHFEGFGLAFLEASSCGLPTVGTTNNGIAEAIQEGVSGLLVEQEDIKATVEALDRLLSDATLRQRMGEAGRKFASTMDWSQTVESYREQYEQAMR